MIGHQKSCQSSLILDLFFGSQWAKNGRGSTCISKDLGLKPYQKVGTMDEPYTIFKYTIVNYLKNRSV